MKSLSYSNYSLLRTCAEKYRLSVIEKIPQPLNVNFEFGSAMHAGLNTALETKDAEAAMDVFQAYWRSVEGKGMEYDRFDHGYLGEMGLKFTSSFTKRLATKMKMIVGEKRMYTSFTLPEADVGTAYLEGTPDALVEWDGRNVLLDFKTSAYNYEKSKTDISLQLNLYAWLLEQNGFKVDALAYIVFNKGAGSLQTPYIVDYKSDFALTSITDMVHYFNRNVDHHEKNLNSCIIGKQICPYFKRCHAKQEASNQSEPETTETEGGSL